MSWEEELFAYLDDLEGRASALYAAERAGELADRTRAEYRTVTLATRLVASVGRDVSLALVGVGTVSGRLARVGSGWCLLHGPGQEWVVVLEAVVTVAGASDRAVPQVAWPAVAQLGLGGALRRLADAAEPCSLHLTDGSRLDVIPVRVGADFVEVATGEVARVLLVPFGRLAAVRSRPSS